jgi:hypothetical protein
MRCRVEAPIEDGRTGVARSWGSTGTGSQRETGTRLIMDTARIISEGRLRPSWAHIEEVIEAARRYARPKPISPLRVVASTLLGW